LFCDIFADLQQIPDRAYPSCGLGRHYTGSAVKAANCQIGVCASHLSRHGQYRHVSLVMVAFAWVGRCRRSARDWDKTIQSAKAWVLIAHNPPPCKNLKSFTPF
jgi:transposase